MISWHRGKKGGLLAFLAIATLVAGGLGWVTAAVLQLEREQLQDRAKAEVDGRLQLALWRLDSRVTPDLAREDSRPFNHFSAVYAPSLTLRTDGQPWKPGQVLELSPLLNADLPDWMLLHFQVDEETKWKSPQVLSPALAKRLRTAPVSAALVDVTPQREQLLKSFSGKLPPRTLLEAVQMRGAQSTTVQDTTLLLAANSFDNNGTNTRVNPNNDGAYNSGMVGRNQPGQLPNYGQFSGQGALSQNEQQRIDQEYLNRLSQQQQFRREGKGTQQKDDVNNVVRSSDEWFMRQTPAPRSEPVAVDLGGMIKFWQPLPDGGEQLLMARLVQVGPKPVCQGIVLDAPRLQEMLAFEVQDLFPEASLHPVREESEDPERTKFKMTALPLELDPGPIPAVADPGLTPLRLGLMLAWAAALVALSAVGLGGWSLLDLAERRIRFVSAVTHELRTPLTTLRLYLDMLTGGFIKEEKQKEEYLHTLNTETDRLNRLVGNVLDFSRLENQRPRLERSQMPVSQLLEQVRATWQGRCHDAGKELVFDNAVGELLLHTDVRLVEQILGNLIDNACKYSRDAEDNRLWLRVRQDGRKRLAFEVEDRGPGVPPREQRSVFRPFRRGHGADVTAGGVGLGLALSRRWAQLLGGRLSLNGCASGHGACFRLDLPIN